jgi:hypothetical protein
MPPSAFALVGLFVACSVVLGIVAVRLVGRAGGPVSPAAYLLPAICAFGAFYLIGHRLGIAVGPEIPLFGFEVSLLGDLAIGLAAALIVAAVQAAVVVRVGRRPGADSGSRSGWRSG